MTNKEFNDQIESWHAIVVKAGITLPSGRKIPRRFWATFLGYGESTFLKFTGAATDTRVIRPNLIRHIRVINRLSQRVFLAEVKAALPAYMERHKR